VPAQRDSIPLAVLVVEDSELDAGLMIRELGRYGYAVEWRRVDRAGALQAELVDREWDVVLSDYAMPGFGGLEALAMIRAADPDLPFILVSGTVGEEAAVAAMRAGAHDYLLKDRLARLGPAVARAVAEAAERRARRRAEDALRIERDRARQYLEVASVMFIAVGPDGRITLANRRAGEILGYTVDELVGRDWFATCIPARQQDAMREVHERILVGDAAQLEYHENPVATRSGDERIIAWHNALLTDASGAVTGTLSAGEDITERLRAEDALRRRERDFVSLVENATDVIVRFDTQFRHVYCNPAVERQLGIPPQVLLGSSPTELPGLREQSEFIERSLRAALESGEETEVEQTFPSPDGLKIFETRIVPERAPDGHVESLLAISREVTDHRRAQEALAREHQLLRTVIDHLPDAVYVKDAQGRKTLANAADLANIGVESESDVLGKTDLDLFPPETAARFRARDMAVLTNGAPVLNQEERLVSRSGRELWLLTSKLPLRDVDGRVVGLVGIGRDITERKMAEVERERLLAQIQAYARQVQQIIDTVPEGVLLLDRAGRVLLANPVAERNLSLLATWGAPRPDASGVAEAPGPWPGALTHVGARPLAELLAPPAEGRWHEVCVGERVWEIQSRPVEDDPAPSGWVMVCRDVTQEREIQRRAQQQERLAAVGQLTAGIAHDFNNIMAVIVLYAQMLERAQGLSTLERERVATINEQAHHAARLIQQMLDFSRRAMLERQPLDLRPLVKEQVKLLERALPETIRIRLDVDEAECLVNADPTRMQQMLMNLAVNARDAMPEGGELRIALNRATVKPGASPLPDMTPGQWVQLVVSDTGAGIPEQALGHMFEPFFTTKEPGKGSGLGLAQVHGIVGQHGGRIGYETKPNLGTSFTIYLPALDASTPVSSTGTPDATMPRGQGELVLLVEDNVAVRGALATGLETLSYRVLEAGDGVEALALLEQRLDEIDLILSDAVMPGMGGVALVHAVRERGWRAPVIILSGHPQGDELADLRDRGVVNWITKPPEMEQLARALADALRDGRAP